MIDLDEFERIVNCFPFDGDILALSKGECKDLLSRLRQAEKDAARYRWLRDTGCFEGSADDLFHATQAETDAEFDRFMQCSK